MNRDFTLITASRYRAFSFGLFLLLGILLLIGGAFAHRSEAPTVVRKDHIEASASAAGSNLFPPKTASNDNAQSIQPEPSPTLDPNYKGLSDATRPKYVGQAALSANAATAQVYINFDNVPAYTPITNQYPPAVFSSDFYHYPLADPQYWNSSYPNILGCAPRFGPYNGSGYDPVFVDFTTPVNDLKFWVVAVDEYRVRIAQVNIFQNNHLVATKDIDGYGRVFQPILIDVAAWGYNNVTRIEIVNINDYLGIGFDDFSFNPAPPPSPSPTPARPAAPTGVTASITQQGVSLSWIASTGATSYYVKRSENNGGPYTSIAAAQSPYVDTTVKSGKTYYYVVTASNAAGESPNSNQATAVVPSICGDNVLPTPPPKHIFSPLSGWDLTVDVSPDDGLVVRNISLNGRYMAKSISIPYFTIATNKTSGTLRGQLKPNSGDQTLRSRLVDFTAEDAGLLGVIIGANYIIDRISPDSDSCMHVTQYYWFWSERMTRDFHGACEPSDTLPCAIFKPLLFYKFESRAGEALTFFNAVQKNEYQVNALPFNGVGIFRDCDSVPGCIFHLEGYVFKYKWNPLYTELKARVMHGGHDFGTWDNIHQTFNSMIYEEPGIDFRHFPPVSGGCPECVHMHWRWGKSIPGTAFGAGTTEFYYPKSNQDMDIAIVKYKSQEQENGEPLDYSTLANGESIRLGKDVGEQLVIYYSATGHQSDDVFFRHLYFFKPSFGSQTKPIQQGSTTEPALNVTTGTDGPVSVTLPNIYQDGSVSYTLIDPHSVVDLPPGYVAYNNVAYNVTTDAIASGPFIVSFRVDSATDQATFNSLRILHTEPDPLDPENPAWIDRTILSPDPQGPDFTNKTIQAKVGNVGPFTIVRQTQAPTTATADLSVTVSSSSQTVVAPNNLTYTATISNVGPATATNVGLIDSLSPDVLYVSAMPSQGTCMFSDGSVYCKLGSLNPGANATVSIVVTPNEAGGQFPAAGVSITNTAFVTANENDPAQVNNTVVKTNNALPNPNSAPTITVTTPTANARFVGPTNISIVATATDSDGAISQVNFYDGETPIGSGTPLGSNQYGLAWNNVGFGNHAIVAVATDSGGRKNASVPINILVNGTASVSVTGPASGTVFTPHSTVSIAANASVPSGNIAKVNFFANDTLLGTLNGGSSPYQVSWTDPPNGRFAITAVVTDSSGIVTTSMPSNIVISGSPTLNLTSPADGASFSSSPTIDLKATGQDDDSVIDKVSFLANGTLIGTGHRSSMNEFTFTWRGAPDGIFAITASATDQNGLTTTTPGITIGINTVTAGPGIFVWLDDDVPVGAVKHGDGEDWYWVDSNPGAYSGAKAHQSRNFAQLDAPNNSFHQHYFDGATNRLPINAYDRLFTYVFLDVNNLPRELMLQWNDGNGWEHRAYWGANRINVGTDGTNSRRYMGPMPAPGKWTRLEVWADQVGLQNTNVSGMAFSLDGGRATFDLAGKFTGNPPLPPYGDFVWVEDAVPTGAILETYNDQWQWLEPHFSGNQGHRSYLTVNQGAGQFRSHSFRNAQATMKVEAGDVLFTYVYLDGNHMPDELVLQWHDGSNWEHRAFWGLNLYEIGRTGTESRRYMGGMPPPNQWYRLEVPASYVGLEGRVVSGMSFGFYSKVDRAGINWDYSGKTTRAAQVPLSLSSVTPIYQIPNGNYGGIYSTTDSGISYVRKFYAHPNQAAATVPMYRFRRPDSGNPEQFYSQSLAYDNQGWKLDGVAFYVYPDGSTPGTVPLHLYHDSRTKYFLTMDENEARSQFYDAIWGYVASVNLLVPNAPTNFGWDGRWLRWKDNSSNETNYKVERWENTNTWSTFAMLPANTTFLKVGTTCQTFRVKAINNNGESAPSDPASACETYDIYTENTPPEVNILSPSNSAVLGKEFTITANVTDVEGAGTIAKVEFYADGGKLGETSETPYAFVWNNAPSGSHSLAAVAFDTAGASKTSAAVSVLVTALASVSITNPADGALFTAPTNIAINASASDPDGSVAKVEFYQNGIKVGEDTSEPYELVIANSSAGSYQLTARAIDNVGLSVDSAPVNVTVNAPPLVTITSPTNGAVVPAPANLAISVNATDSDGTTNKVEFYQGTTLIGTATNPPFATSWNNVAAGVYSITAKATDDRGATATSAPVSVTVNSSPTVSITSPTNSSVFQPQANVPISATAIDPDGTISKVEFFNGETLIGAVTVSPFAFTWNNVPAGNHSLTAKATDNLGAAVTSSPVNITVVFTPRDWYWKFDEGNGLVVEDSNGSSNQGTLANGATWAMGKSGTAINFDGADDRVSLSPSGLADVTNNFTLSFWALPSVSHEIDPETTSGVGGTSGEKYAFGPGWSDSGHAGAGVSVATNGISVYEHAANYMPATLVYPANISGWTHVTVVYENKQPKLYINGVFVKVGQTSPMNYVHVMPYYIGGMGYGYFAGLLDEVRIYNRSLSATEVFDVYNTTDNLTLGGKVVFASNRDGSAQLYLMKTDGTYQTRLTNNLSNDEAPRWSPNNSRIVFQSDRDNLFSGAADIYVMNGDGSDQTRLTADAHDDSAPVWSPDGTKIAFQSLRNGINYQIYVMNADGSGQVNISNNTANDVQPSWSPDGTRIAFASDRDQLGFSSIYVMNGNGSSQTRLTFNGSRVRDEQPAWSPDGMRLAFTSTRDSVVVTWQETDDEGAVLVRTAVQINKEVYVMNADGSAQLRLTNTLENDDSPAWSSDGTKIVFRSDRERECCDPVAQIWLMNFDGSNQLNLSSNSFGDYFPSWSH